MKNGRTAGIMLAAANMVLIVASAVLYIGMDRTEPRFEFMETNIVYEEGMEESRLLEGISAYDDVDGDLTDKIVVEKKIENQERNLAVIFFAVSDKSGNVAKCSREFPAVYQTETGEADSQELQDGPLVQSGVWNILEGGGTGNKGFADAVSKEAGKENGGQDTEGGQPEADNLERNGGDIGEEENEDAIEEGEGREDMEQGQEEEGETGQEEERETRRDQQSREQDGQAVRNVPDSEKPVLELKVSEVTTRTGVAPAWVNVIGTLSDDKDSYETLFRNLEISEYNINQAGTYQVNVSTKDSDGNMSKAVPLTIIVK